MCKANCICLFVKVLVLGKAEWTMNFSHVNRLQGAVTDIDQGQAVNYDYSSRWRTEDGFREFTPTKISSSDFPAYSPNPCDL